MGLIYKHATCNIAATWARNGAEGCFSPRNPADVEPWKMKLAKGPKKKKREFRVVWADYEEVVEDAPLNTRGWVLQERCLSPRQLQFTKDEVYWECSRYIASERFPTGMPRDSDDQTIQGDSLGKPRLNHREKDELQCAWAELVQKYSRARLTVYTDKTIAISGLANELRERHGGQYLAGLWKKHLHRQLCWSVDAIRNYSSPTRHFRGAGPYIAPTWSWMSVDSVVDYDERYWADYDSVLHLAQVLSASVRSSHPSGLHSFLDGSLRMRVMGMWCRGVADTDGDFETKHILRQPSDPAKRSAAAFRVLLQGREIDIIWDEGVSEDEGTDDEDEASEEDGTSEDDSSRDEEESGEDGWSTCGEDEETSEEDSSSDEEESGDDERSTRSKEESAGKNNAANEHELVGQEEGENAVSRNKWVSEEVGGSDGEGISEDGRQLPRDPREQNDEPSGLAAGAVDMRRSDLLLAFVHLSTKERPERRLQGLVLAEKPGSSTEFVRLGVFEYQLKNRKGGGSKNDFVELFKSRLGWNGRKFGALEVDLGDARFADIVHTVTVV